MSPRVYTYTLAASCSEQCWPSAPIRQVEQVACSAAWDRKVAGQRTKALPRGDRWPVVQSPPSIAPLHRHWRRGNRAMARTYREVAIEEMLQTVEEAMHRVIDWWGVLPPPMEEAVEQFRTQLGAAIDSVEFVKRALDREVPETDGGEG